MQKIDITQIIFDHTGLSPRDAHKLRGFVGSRFTSPLFHNHDDQGGFRYRYPLVQYKIIGDRAHILGIGAGGDALCRLFLDLDHLEIEGRNIALREKQIIRGQKEFGWVAEPIGYSFLCPWLALNQKNHLTWQAAADEDRRSLLERTLTANILSMAKGLEYFLSERIAIQGRFSPVEVRFKNQPMIAFRGHFQTNFIIPDLLGLGKSCARGYGAVRKTRSNPQ